MRCSAIGIFDHQVNKYCGGLIFIVCGRGNRTQFYSQRSSLIFKVPLNIFGLIFYFIIFTAKTKLLLLEIKTLKD